MREYIPTTEEVKHGFTEFENAFRDLYEVETGFHRWLAEHDRELSERVWEQGASCGAAAALNGTGLIPNPYLQILDEEQRRYHVEQAMHSNRLEGLESSPELKADMELYILGELTLQEVGQRTFDRLKIDKSYN